MDPKLKNFKNVKTFGIADLTESELGQTLIIDYQPWL
jgi:hypothetical protein